VEISTAKSAIGLLELKGAAPGLVAVDVAVKTASIEILQAKVECPGKYVVIMAGEIAAVEAGMAAAKAAVGSGLYDFSVLGRIHPALYWGLHDQFHQGERASDGSIDGDGAALGIVETITIATGLLAADKALKTAAVCLRELRLAYALGGRSYFIFSGATGAVQAALASAVEVATERGSLGSECVILKPTTTR